MNVAEIITHIEQNLNRTQATGLNCLIFLALREGSDVAHHWNEWGFADIPQQVIVWCDELLEDELLNVATAIINGLLDDIFTAALGTENAQKLTPQAIKPQNQPTLLSDY
ncbi:hypothetical protein FD723_15565 [Nostoc sp. C052]|uniref:hypothetical protein n=1 Tax=Nostoc sp. C052 TaxID=2576902 RepID=UPI0015C31A37|nr:hypothetical protein [Nostoc sp. C052]QLE41694.1 hypothetical protein FD723_15565 [Nostoc sp. C052]